MLWPPALHSAVLLPREALRSCYCSILIGLSAARLPKRLLRSPRRYRRRTFGAWSQCAWRPEKERAEVDGIVRKARAAGVDCAQWEAGSTETILATAIDGAATQGFLLVSPAGRKKRISSILTKGGVADAWSGEPESRRRIEAALADSGMDAPMLAVSRSYLDRVLSHQLALSVEREGHHPRSAYSRLPRRSVASTGNPRAWTSAKR